MSNALALDSEPSVEEKVAFLRCPSHYPGRPAAVDVVETHNSWVFLAGDLVYKLKKPVRYDFLDFSTPEARRVNCQRELELNQRLAGDVYRGVVALTMDGDGRLHLGEPGSAVDWLVMMRRLPSARMLDAAIARNAPSDSDLEPLCRLLIDFYRRSPPLAVDPREYRGRFTEDIVANRAELRKSVYTLSAIEVERVCDAQLDFVARQGELLEQRARDRRIIDAHGDLRPEHICLTTEPVIIDCLEFKREFRLLDPVDELAYLAMECERLGSARIGDYILRRYLESAADSVPESLVWFYKAFRSSVRARIAVLHIADHDVPNPDKWRRRANEYLELAASYAARSS